MSKRIEIKIDDAKPKGYELLQNNLKAKAMEQKLILVTAGEKPNVELGIDEVKKIIKAIKEIEEARAIVMADGKVTISDFISHPVEVIWEPAKAIYEVIKTKDLIAQEILRIDENEANELIKTVAEEFNMLPENVTVKIGHIIKAAWHIGEIFKN